MAERAAIVPSLKTAHGFNSPCRLYSVLTTANGINAVGRFLSSFWARLAFRACVLLALYPTYPSRHRPSCKICWTIRVCILHPSYNLTKSMEPESGPEFLPMLVQHIKIDKPDCHGLHHQANRLALKHVCGRSREGHCAIHGFRDAFSHRRCLHLHKVNPYSGGLALRGLSTR